VTIDKSFGQVITPSQKSNFHLFLDEHEQLWISTIDGLNIYNGKSISVFNASNSGMLGNNIQSPFYNDSYNNIWFSSYTALNKYMPGASRFVPYRAVHPAHDTLYEDYSILSRSGDLLLFRAAKSLFIHDIVKDSSAFITDCDLTSSSTLSKALHTGNYHYIFASTALKAYLLRLDTPTRQVDTLLVMDAPNSKPQVFHKNSFVFSDENGQLFKLNPVTLEIKQLLDLHEKIYNIDLFKDSILSILLDKKIIQYQLDPLKPINTIPLDIEGTKTSVYTDPNATVWVSVDGKGIFSFHPDKRKFNHITNIHSGKPANARSFIQLGTGDILYSSRDNGVGRMDAQLRFIQQYNTASLNCPSDFVLRIDNNASDDVYAISSYALLRLNMSTNSFEEIPLDINSYFYDMLINSRDEILLAGNDSNQVYKVIPSASGPFQTVKVLDRYPDNYILSLFELSDNRLVIGVNAQSFAVYNPCSSGYCYDTTYNIASDIKSIWEVPDAEDIYVSSSGGLYHFPKGMEGPFSKLTDKEGLLNQCIYFILGHGKDLWLSSNKGLLRYNIPTGDIHRFTEADGIQGSEYNTTAGLTDRKGRFIFGGTNGINYFHPDSVRYIDYNSTVYISNFLINDESTDQAGNPNYIENIELSYKQNTLSFWFHGIDHSDPSNVDLRYMLENYDNDWVDINENNGRIRYANLPAGSYTLKLHACNSDGIWSDHNKTIGISITPPFWPTLWFRIMTLALLGLIVWWLIRTYYRRQLREKDLALREQKLVIEKQKALEAERSRIASEMHDDLGGGLTSIKFLSHKLLKQMDKEPELVLQKIVSQSNRLIQNMSEIIWAMNAGNDTLGGLLFYLRDFARKYLEDFRISLESDFPKIDLGTTVTGEKRRNIFLIFKEVLHNAVKHSEADKIKIEARLANSLLELSIADNGIGFDASGTFRTNGLININKRIRSLDGNYDLQSDRQGTRFVFRIPLTPN